VNDVTPEVPTDSDAQPAVESRTYHKGFFYQTSGGTWVVDYGRRTHLTNLLYRDSVKYNLTSAKINEIIDITKTREIAPGEIYTPSAKLLAKLAEAEAKERAKDQERKRSRSDSPYPRSSSSKGDSPSDGRGYGYRPE